MKRELPEIIKKVGFDFDWDEHKVWDLDIPVETIPISELTWHFDIPFWQSNPEKYYDLKPRDVMKYPKKYVNEYERAMRADINYPIDIMYYGGRWLILDGLHRLMKQSIQKTKNVRVREIPESFISKIKK